VPAPTVPPPEEVRRRARTILGRLKKRYPLAGTALEYRDPWQLLVATVLSAQTTDANVNRATPRLFACWPSPEDLAAADPEEVEAVVHSTGYYRQKTRSIISLSADLVERFGGEVPGDMAALTGLRGVGRKTASVVLAEAFGSPAIAVDTHVGRISRRLGLSRHAEPAKVEADLRALYPRREWAGVSMRFILFGREVCTARRPHCGACPLVDRCPYPGKNPAG
jgi:endonuclease-3